MLHHENTVITEHSITTGAQTFRYLAAGSGGVPIVFIHGWPQSADEFRGVMQRLAANHLVLAPDLRGIGGTSSLGQDWTKEALAHDLRDFMTKLDLDQAVVVGHDIGGMVAYAYARLFPDTIRGVAVLDVPLPGIAPWDDLVVNPVAWHFAFHAQKPLAEDLVMGRQATYFGYFMRHVAKHPEAITDEDVAVYAAAYGSREQLSAGFELYRAFPADRAFVRTQTGQFYLPLLLVGAEYSVGGALPMIAEDLKAHGVTDVRCVVIEDSGHWIMEEQPAATADAIASFIADLTTA